MRRAPQRAPRGSGGGSGTVCFPPTRLPPCSSMYVTSARTRSTSEMQGSWSRKRVPPLIDREPAVAPHAAPVRVPVRAPTVDGRRQAARQAGRSTGSTRHRHRGRPRPCRRRRGRDTGGRLRRALSNRSVAGSSARNRASLHTQGERRVGQVAHACPPKNQRSWLPRTTAAPTSSSSAQHRSALPRPSNDVAHRHHHVDARVGEDAQRQLERSCPRRGCRR